jgi:hypothetical protein
MASTLLSMLRSKVPYAFMKALAISSAQKIDACGLNFGVMNMDIQKDQRPKYYRYIHIYNIILYIYNNNIYI